LFTAAKTQNRLRAVLFTPICTVLRCINQRLSAPSALVRLATTFAINNNIDLGGGNTVSMSSVNSGVMEVRTEVPPGA
jgi:hypothetical protein